MVYQPPSLSVIMWLSNSELQSSQVGQWKLSPVPSPSHKFRSTRAALLLEEHENVSLELSSGHASISWSGRTDDSVSPTIFLLWFLGVHSLLQPYESYVPSWVHL